MCPICLETLHDPLVHLNCMQSFCCLCIEKALNSKSICPICNTKCKIQNFVPVQCLGMSTSRIQILLDSIEPRLPLKPSSILPPETSPVDESINAVNSNISILIDEKKAVISRTMPDAVELIPLDSTLLKNISFRPGDVVNVLPRTWIGINKVIPFVMM